MSEPMIAVEAIEKRFKKTTAVDKVSFSVEAGQTVGLLGPNGAGKSTLVELISGLRAPDQGEIHVAGLDPRRQRRRLRQLLGVQLQQVRLHDQLTTAEIIDLYRSFYPDPRERETLLEMLQLSQQRSTRFGKLSGGQQQRLSVALALVGTPEVVILDELTTGLDPVARRRVWAVIRSLTEETFLVVSHAMDEVERLCDKVIILEHGRKIAEGTPAQIMAQTQTANLEEAFIALTGDQLSLEDLGIEKSRHKNPHIEEEW